MLSGVLLRTYTYFYVESVLITNVEHTSVERSSSVISVSLNRHRMLLSSVLKGFVLVLERLSGFVRVCNSRFSTQQQKEFLSVFA